MIGMTITIGDITGIVTAQTVSPDGKAMVRIEDRWMLIDGV